MNTMTPDEARTRFGKLTRVSGGATTWLMFETKEGTWEPEFNGICNLIGYSLVPIELGPCEEPLTPAIRQELIAAANSNLKNHDCVDFMNLIDGDYKNDEPALRGFIWNCIEGYEDE